MRFEREGSDAGSLTVTMRPKDPSAGAPKTSATARVYDARRRERLSACIEGRVIREDGTSVRVRLVDMNFDGCGICVPIELRPGELVEIVVLSRGFMPAQVRWCHDGRAGLEFGPLAGELKTKARREESPMEACETSSDERDYSAYDGYECDPHSYWQTRFEGAEESRRNATDPRVGETYASLAKHYARMRRLCGLKRRRAGFPNDDR